MPPHLAVEFSTGLHFEHVSVVCLLVDGDLGVPLPAEPLARADEDVHRVDLVHGEVELVVLLALGLGRVLDDGLLPVYPVLLQLVGQHALHWLKHVVVRIIFENMFKYVQSPVCI